MPYSFDSTFTNWSKAFSWLFILVVDVVLPCEDVRLIYWSSNGVVISGLPHLVLDKNDFAF